MMFNLNAMVEGGQALGLLEQQKRNSDFRVALGRADAIVRSDINAMDLFALRNVLTILDSIEKDLKGNLVELTDQSLVDSYLKDLAVRIAVFRDTINGRILTLDVAAGESISSARGLTRRRILITAGLVLASSGAGVGVYYALRDNAPEILKKDPNESEIPGAKTKEGILRKDPKTGRYYIEE